MSVHRPIRSLKQSEKETIEKLYGEKEDRGCLNSSAFVTAAEDMILQHWNGDHPVGPNTKEVHVSKGSTLKIVMVSRFGDCGLTDDLEAYSNYGIRLYWNDAAMTDIRLTKQPTPPELFDSVGIPSDRLG